LYIIAYLYLFFLSLADTFFLLELLLLLLLLLFFLLISEARSLLAITKSVMTRGRDAVCCLLVNHDKKAQRIAARGQLRCCITTRGRDGTCFY
jgi:competence protein ComGC